jgi:hypothetical protein
VVSVAAAGEGSEEVGAVAQNETVVLSPEEEAKAALNKEIKVGRDGGGDRTYL